MDREPIVDTGGVREDAVPGGRVQGGDGSVAETDEEHRLELIRDEVVSLIAHDLRAPLCVVIGYLDLLRGPLTTSARDRAIEVARRNGERMSELLDDLQAASHADRLLASTSFDRISLADLAEEVVASLEQVHAGPRLSCDPVDRPVVRGDGMRLRQVLVNLVMNALKYSPPVSPVRVSVTRSAATAIVHVVDHGPGIPEDQRQRVFERFVRLGDGDNRIPGVGLGLYIVRIISENHGGTVSVQETPGGGATFVVELPCLNGAGSVAG